ncbi:MULTISPECIES: porphobilinogen synthase [Brevibacillus]|uniref:Delta-aminolevulinic acid dehydratase n=1 Tax=Brevibacillus borstelensis AK1 TaxID=1300222 RepID=M8E0L0_9BACL|nr:porphobilinogen synthase [Brevibacillus borstelensis]EMT52831.1 delta-aminolevulinic acid dehydratase [Brevibacillus borstelensis AK1]KKX55751.1 delta-aminolevulinic acid dehydratase [Brevibacillus borstelensis cifa_chp40]MBE5397194.1 porphobilinogen synthase [Brevibacillus borstelensis]MCC0564909.1 porphobilinogen synthase [Brevibacillus borstelensis]MCM3470626.1 porphobilinogen synthase [Brevibacillus borstelensis]
MAISFDRHRRLRTSAGMRDLVRENHVRLEDLIYPLFVVEGTNVKEEIPSMPGVYHFSLDRLREELDEIASLGIKSLMMFGVPEHKDACGSEAYNDNAITQQAIRQIKEAYPDMVVIADTCLCQYTDHGHCGVLHEGEIDNDESLKLLVATAVSQAKAGADIIAPSNMMDGFVAAIREGLDEAGFVHVPIMSYSVKYASSFYGPFRDAAHSTPKSGDRKTYQMDPANAREGLREAASDVAEGADFLMVKPGLAFMDMVLRLRESFDLPLVVYNVSAEYSMVKAASANGWINEQQIVMETLLGFKRAGADLIITYHAKDVAKWLRGE